MKCQKIIFVALYSVTVASRQRRFPCRRRRQDLGVNKNPPLNKEDFDLEEGGFLLSDRVKMVTLLEWRGVLRDEFLWA